MAKQCSSQPAEKTDHDWSTGMRNAVLQADSRDADERVPDLPDVLSRSRCVLPINQGYVLLLRAQA